MDIHKVRTITCEECGAAWEAHTGYDASTVFVDAWDKRFEASGYDDNGAYLFLPHFNRDSHRLNAQECDSPLIVRYNEGNQS